MNRLLHRIVLTTTAAGITTIIAACGSASSGGTDHQGMPGMPGMNGTPTSAAASSTSTTTAMPTAGQDHNAADVTFAAGMVPHHQQAVTMARTALQRSSNPQVTALARDIEAAQGPEIATMSGWLSAWGQPVSTAGGHDMSQMNGGTAGGMGGMMSDQEMQQLESATGAAFDRMWVQLMIRHHQGAVAMSTAELATGQNAAAKQLAQQIISAQDKEITVMQQLLTTLPV